MSDRKTGNSRTLIAAIIVVIILLSGIIFAVGNKDDNKGDKTAKTAPKSEQKDESEDKNDGEVEGVTIVTPGNTEWTETSTPKKVASVNTASQTPTPAQPQNQQPAQPQNPTNPSVVPQEPAEEPDEEPEEEYIIVTAGGASESYTFETTDGSLVKWYSCNEAVVQSDEQLPDKSAYKVYFVIESAQLGETGLVPASSVTFHVRATADATPGLLEYDGVSDVMITESLAFCLADENNEIIEVIQVPVMVLPAEEEILEVEAV